MQDFTPVPALIGGGLVGAAAAALLTFNGQIAGVSGIVGSAMSSRPGWRWSFLGGLLVGGTALAWVYPAAYASTITTPAPYVAVAGLLVGFGTTLGSGCTSGHGVCGNSQLSTRSLVATCIFIAAGALGVVARRALLGDGA
ncbi:MAG: YeeE/YedE family protein [Myxococcales bacterium]|nr:YeeE/YedE family protein [Myxococcales bacterium]